MRMIQIAALLAFVMPSVANANDWKENFVRWIAEGNYIRSEAEPESAPSAGTVDADFEAMYRRGLVPIGYSLFESGNEKTRDSERWAKELGASHIIFGIDLES